MLVDDPRTFPDGALAPQFAMRMHEKAAASLAAATGQLATSLDAEICAELANMLGASHRDGLGEILCSAPSAAVYRHLWRLLAQCSAGPVASGGLAVTLFALPIVLVAGIEGRPTDERVIPGIMPNAVQLAALLREHRALAGNQNFALANTLVTADAIGLARLPALLEAAARCAGTVTVPDLPPAPIELRGAIESVHLRFIVGAAVAAPNVNLLRDGEVGAWGMPLAQALAAQLRIPGVTLLPLPRAPLGLLAAITKGQSARRDVGAQVFASNALRKFRASVGEPSAVISAHRGNHAGASGELRLSLSSPFAMRDAEGFRCPLYPVDSVQDVATMLVDLMRDCRVDDVRVLPGIHADRDALSGAPLLFKPETLPPPTPRVH